MSLLIRDLLFAPADTVGGSPEAEQSTKNFLLADDDDEAIDIPASEEEPVKEEVKDLLADGTAETTEEETDEKEEEALTLEDELEETLKEPDEDKLQADLDPPTRRQILAKYPNLFKDIPYLQTAFYREQKFTEMYPTIKDAEIAREKSEALDNFSNSLLEGDLAQVFQYAVDQDKNAFYRLVDNMMIDLGKVDEGAQIHVIGNVGKHIVEQMYRAGEAGEDNALKAAAHILNQFITGTKQWVPPQKLAKEDKNPENERLAEERRQLHNERYSGVREDLIATLDKRIHATLEKHIDPKGTMTPFTKNAAIKEAKLKIQSMFTNDTRFNNVVKQVWIKAAKSNYSKADVDLIKKSYSNKAELLLPSVIKSVRAEALKGLSSRKRGTDDDELQVEIREPQKRGPVAPGKSAPTNSGRQSALKAPPKGMSVKQFLMSDE